MVYEQVTSEFLKHIASISSIQIINYILTKEYVGNALKYAKEKLKQKHLERKYFFSPTPEELENLKSIEKSEIYQRTKKLLGIHPSFSLLRLGMFVNKLNEKGRKDKVGEVREQVFKRYHSHGLKILALASTGELEYVLGNLSDYYQRTGCDIIKLCNLFDYILMRWKNITLFIKKKFSPKEIENMINKLIEQKYPYFLIFSYGSASTDAYKTIAKMDVKGSFRDNNYMPQLRRSNEKEGDYAWAVEHLEKDAFDFLS